MRPPRPRRRVLPSSVLLVALALTAPAACSSGPEAGPSAPSAEPDERIATVLELRAAVGPSAAELGTAAATLVDQLEALHAEAAADPEARREAVDTVREGAVARLETALTGSGPELAGDASGPDATAVRDALAAAHDAGGALLGDATRDLAISGLTADADERLAAVVTAWGEPGSRSQQLQRLAEVAVEAETLAADLDAAEDVPECFRRLARRAGAARTVAEATIELRSLVERRRGEEFDARRDELVADPFGTGRSLVEEDREEVPCWREEGPVTASAGEVAAALESLESALNPPDLRP